jgi:hypothetical protein
VVARTPPGRTGLYGGPRSRSSHQGRHGGSCRDRGCAGSRCSSNLANFRFRAAANWPAPRFATSAARPEATSRCAAEGPGEPCNFYAALARAPVWSAASAAEQAQHLEALAVDYRLLQEWADNCPENFANRAPPTSQCTPGNQTCFRSLGPPRGGGFLGIQRLLRKNARRSSIEMAWRAISISGLSAE